MAKPAEHIIIRNEATAFQVLEAALNEEFAGRNVTLDFKGWPKLTLRLTGPGYDSTITPDVAQALIDLQHALNRAYARAVHHATSARSLTADERREINLKARVQPGSSLVEVNLGDYAEKLATALAGKMTSEHIVITVLGLAAIAGGVVAMKAWLGSRNEAIKVEAEAKRAITMSQEETKRHQVLAEALGRRDHQNLKFAEADFGDVRREMLRSGGDAETLTLQGISMQGRDARALATTPRSQAEDVQLNGHYTIQKIDLHDPESYRLSVTSMDGHGSFVASLRSEALSRDEQERLNSGTWGRQRLYMAINGTRLRGEVTTASIVSIEWPKKK